MFDCLQLCFCAWCFLYRRDFNNVISGNCLGHSKVKYCSASDSVISNKCLIIRSLLIQICDFILAAY